MWDNIKDRLTSRKFWVAIVSSVAVVLTNTFGLDPDAATRITYSIVIIAVAYITDQSLVDIFKDKFSLPNEKVKQ